jgi:hypothetical protein
MTNPIGYVMSYKFWMALNITSICRIRICIFHRSGYSSNKSALKLK